MTQASARIIVLGATGMLGSTTIRLLAAGEGLEVVGVSRANNAARFFAPSIRAHFVGGVGAEDQDGLVALFREVRPTLVINCIGLVKQLQQASDVLSAIPINALLPHRLAALCALADARLVQISTDCVFSGERGGYRETDRPDAVDLYGVSKRLGEVTGTGAVTLRTSIIGHELRTSHSLLEWFLSQEGSVKGFRRAIFSGLPTLELARIIRDHVIPNPNLSGLYHVSVEPISKYDLLKLIAAEYGIKTKIVPDDALVIDRSLNSDLFKGDTSYAPPSWPDLVRAMRLFG